MKQCIVYVKYFSDIRDHFVCKLDTEPVTIDKKKMVVIGPDGKKLIDLDTVKHWNKRLMVDMEYHDGTKESYNYNVEGNPEIVIEKLLIMETTQGRVEIKLKDVKEWERVYKEIEDKTINVEEE